MPRERAFAGSDPPTSTTVVVTATIAALPSPPQNLATTPADGRVMLQWEAPESDGGASRVLIEKSA